MAATVAAFTAAPSSCCAAAASAAASASSSPASAIRPLPLRRAFHGAPVKLHSATMPGSLRFAPLKATTSSEETGTTTSTEDVSKQVEDIFSDLKTKWESVENKSTVLVYGGGALVTLWFSATIVGAINSVPLLPKVMELVGLGYTGWFVYRYLLFKSSRKELLEDVEELKKKITGATESV
ncbi:protein CURVATURE THYLAKOID 1A, chloroplastic [Selaginella moellendorffii]|uniref:protein CURVATURE THYLAKOID 1A, chloroplastic n=1 Tax=Selaginella moellendorffii TaxID=88036 RepID=UPI000D1C5465|nr:protein CURVATURE THYLAKOID 1A, chloroplastic [Selaginella moellendorffii]|eukprot:XP_002984041.2 protein CURVATURE THYLAKOID 1A, chloroplastic [Selaginella moellendorffii]